MSTIEVEGVDEVLAMLKLAPAEIAAGVKTALREGAVTAAERAKQKAGEQGFDPPGRSGRGTGALVRDIRAGVRGGTAFIRETAHRGDTDMHDTEYPRIYEFGRGGERSFMRPAVAEVAPEVLAAVDEEVQKALSKLQA